MVLDTSKGQEAKAPTHHSFRPWWLGSRAREGGCLGHGQCGARSSLCPSNHLTVARRQACLNLQGCCCFDDGACHVTVSTSLTSIGQGTAYMLVLGWGCAPACMGNVKSIRAAKAVLHRNVHMQTRASPLSPQTHSTAAQRANVPEKSHKEPASCSRGRKQPGCLRIAAGLPRAYPPQRRLARHRTALS